MPQANSSPPPTDAPPRWEYKPPARAARLVGVLERKRAELLEQPTSRTCREARAAMLQVATAIEEAPLPDSDRKRVLDAYFDLDHAIDDRCTDRSRPRSTVGKGHGPGPTVNRKVPLAPPTSGRRATRPLRLRRAGKLLLRLVLLATVLATLSGA